MTQEFIEATCMGIRFSTAGWKSIFLLLFFFLFWQEREATGCRNRLEFERGEVPAVSFAGCQIDAENY